MRKRPRLHFLDTGLVCYLLGIHSPALLKHHPLRGSIFESFVIGEIIKGFENDGREAPLFFWRDATGHEMDGLIGLGDRLVPLAIKSGLTVAADSVDALRWWTGLPGNRNKRGVLVHGGDRTLSLHGSTILPWFLRGSAGSSLTSASSTASAKAAWGSSSGPRTRSSRVSSP